MYSMANQKRPRSWPLSKKWTINSCPNVVFADATGRPYALLQGVEEREPIEAFLKRLESHRQQRLKRDEIDAQSRDAVLRKERAAALRHSATEACGDHRWGECRNGLDDARELDPPGEGMPEVKALRITIEQASAPPK